MEAKNDGELATSLPANVVRDDTELVPPTIGKKDCTLQPGKKVFFD
jgi:hypothetical protein